MDIVTVLLALIMLAINEEVQTVLAEPVEELDELSRVFKSLLSMGLKRYAQLLPAKVE